MQRAGGCCGPSEPRAGQSRPGASSRRRSWVLGAGERCGVGAQRIKPQQLPTPWPLLPLSTPPLRGEHRGRSPEETPKGEANAGCARSTPVFPPSARSLRAPCTGCGAGGSRERCGAGGEVPGEGSTWGVALLCSPLACVEKHRYAPGSGRLGRTPLPPDLSPFLQTNSESIVFSGEQNIPQPKPKPLCLPDLTASSKLSKRPSVVRCHSQRDEVSPSSLSLRFLGMQRAIANLANSFDLTDFPRVL